MWPKLGSGIRCQIAETFGVAIQYTLYFSLLKNLEEISIKYSGRVYLPQDIKIQLHVYKNGPLSKQSVICSEHGSLLDCTVTL